MPGGTEPAFKTAGQKIGLEIWRVKDFKLQLVDRREYGIFYGGDSYLLLNTFGDPKKPSHDVHIWIGSETTQMFLRFLNHFVKDEYGTAAIKMVELDDALGGWPVQHREVQGHESAAFLKYFKGGTRYMKGGHDSGFSHVSEEAFKPRLFHVKGRKAVKVRQVELGAASLNKGDAFILDTGKKLFVWLPANCNHAERREGIRQAMQIRDQERSGRADYEVLDSDWDTNPEFWALIGGNVGSVKADSASDDDDFLKSAQRKVRLFKVSDASGKMQKTKVGEGALTTQMLDTNDAFILDVDNSIFVWIGRKCNKSERTNAIKYATEHLSAEGRPNWIPVTRVLEGAEPSLFTQWFGGGDASFKAVLYHISDASGRMSVETLAEFTQQDLCSDDAMVLDTRGSIFVWLGGGASGGEKAKAEAMARHHLATSGIPRPPGAAVRTVQDGQEPPEFKAAFSGWGRGAANLHNVVESIHL